MFEYKFEVKGQPALVLKAKSHLDAYGQANQHFGSLPQGAWMQSVMHGCSFYWALGNFFD
jgi:hypothetical protein